MRKVRNHWYNNKNSGHNAGTNPNDYILQLESKQTTNNLIFTHCAANDETLTWSPTGNKLTL